VLPNGMRATSVSEHENEPSTSDLPTASWVAREDGRVVGIAALWAGQPRDPRATTDVPAGARRETIGGRDAVVIESTGMSNWVFEADGCDLVRVVVQGIPGALPDDAIRTIVGSVRCRDDAGRLTVVAETPNGLDATSPFTLQPTRVTGIDLRGTRSNASLTILDGLGEIDGRLLGLAGSGERTTIGNVDVVIGTRTTSFASTDSDGNQTSGTREVRVFLWQPTPTVWARLDSSDLDDDQLAAIVQGARVVSEDEWQAWVATINGDRGTTGTTAAPGSASGTAVATTLASTVTIRTLADLVEAGETVWYVPTTPPVALATSSHDGDTCLALLTLSGRDEQGCVGGHPSGFSSTSAEVEGLGKVWLGLTGQGPSTITKFFGPEAVGWVGPTGPDGRAPYLATSVPEDWPTTAGAPGTTATH
jgi:hypothetical protein